MTSAWLLLLAVVACLTSTSIASDEETPSTGEDEETSNTHDTTTPPSNTELDADLSEIQSVVYQHIRESPDELAELDASARGLIQPRRAPDGDAFEPDSLSSSTLDLAALKADPSLMRSLGEWLDRYGIQLPPSLLSRVEETDLCPESALEGLKHYCLKMENGQYYDPWNPWCGYIECMEGTAMRMCCKGNTWMGMGASRSGTFLTKNDMCRRPLRDRVRAQRCVEHTDYNLCKKVEAIEALNPYRVTPPRARSSSPASSTTTAA